jgi:hypothetical protein
MLSVAAYGAASRVRCALTDLLEDPFVAIGIGEPDERAVRPSAGIHAGNFVRRRTVVENSADVVEEVADVDAATDQRRSGPSTPGVLRPTARYVERLWRGSRPTSSGPGVFASSPARRGDRVPV